MSKLLMKTDVAAPGLQQMERDEARSALITRRRIAVAEKLREKMQ
jgi:hypothetical protein